MTIGPAFGVQVDPRMQVVPLTVTCAFTSAELGMLVNVFTEPLIDLFVSVWVSVVPTMRPLGREVLEDRPHRERAAQRRKRWRPRSCQ